MALIKGKDLGYATYVAAYTRIVGFSWNERGNINGTNIVKVKTVTYVDKASRLAGKDHMTSGGYRVELAHEGLTLQKLYLALKGLTDFEGATDDL